MFKDKDMEKVKKTKYKQSRNMNEETENPKRNQKKFMSWKVLWSKWKIH